MAPKLPPAQSPVQPAAPCARNKILVALCALFTIAVPIAIIAAVVIPRMHATDTTTPADATSTTPSPTQPLAPAAITPSATTPAPASPTTPVSGTVK